MGSSTASAAERAPVRHGTDAGYQQHHLQKVLPPCQPCSDAHSAALRRYRQNATPAARVPDEAIQTVARALEIYLAPCRLPPDRLRDAALVALCTARAMLGAGGE